MARVPGWAEYGGWQASNYLGSAYIPYNNATLDYPGVFIEGTNFFQPSIQGNYSVLIWGGDTPSLGSGNTALGQTGQIPPGTQTVTYWAQGDFNPLQVTFHGQMLSFIALSTTANYTIYGADISAFAGQTGELRFSVSWNAGPPVMFDNIQFSNTPIPEPGTIELFFLGLIISRKKKSHRRVFGDLTAADNLTSAPRLRCQEPPAPASRPAPSNRTGSGGNCAWLHPLLTPDSSRRTK